MIFGGYSKGKEDLPRVFQISIARFSRELPGPGEPLSLLVAIHEEGTGITWQQNITVEPDTERYFLDTTETLYRRGLGYGGGTPESALAAVDELGRKLWATFLGDAGAAYLADSRPTALLLDVDETTLNLPWELMAWNGNPLALEFPFGRIVRTRARPRPGRDPLQEDAEARILAIANPTTDLAAAEREVAAIAALAGDHGKFKIAVDVLARGDATRANFLARLTRGDYDIVHFAGHAGFDPTEPEASALRLADGFVTADELLALDWKAPPYLVFNSACESGRAAGGARLVSDQGQANGLAAAFLACGAAAYAGYFWPVTDDGSCRFTETFYPALFGLENVGLAFQEARKSTVLGSGPGRRPVRVQRRAVRRRGLGQAPRSRHGRVSDNPSRLRRQLPKTSTRGPKYLNGRVVATSAVSLRWQHESHCARDLRQPRHTFSPRRPDRKPHLPTPVSHHLAWPNALTRSAVRRVSDGGRPLHTQRSAVHLLTRCTFSMRITGFLMATVALSGLLNSLTPSQCMELPSGTRLDRSVNENKPWRKIYRNVNYTAISGQCRKRSNMQTFCYDMTVSSHWMSGRRRPRASAAGIPPR